MVHRLKDPSAIEARLLELAHTTDAKITAPALAYFAPCSIEDAANVLDELTGHDRLSMEIEDDGTIYYVLPGRQKFAAKQPEPQRVLRPAVSRALVPITANDRVASPLLAAVLSVFIPGAGHLYASRVVSAILWFLVVGWGYTMILPGLVLHLFAIASAASAARQLNVGAQRLQLAA